MTVIWCKKSQKLVPLCDSFHEKCYPWTQTFEYWIPQLEALFGEVIGRCSLAGEVHHLEWGLRA